MKTSDEILSDLFSLAGNELSGYSYQMFTYDPLNDSYKAYPQPDEPLNKLIDPAQIDDYAEILQKEPVYQARFLVRNGQFFLPMLHQERLLGWFSVSAVDGQDKDLEGRLHVLGKATAENVLSLVQIYTNQDLERKNHELGILSRIAQGINITIHFDDMLELIYAQTTQVIPATIFRIMLFSKPGNLYTYAFYLENEERVSRRENILLLGFETIEQRVIQTRKAVLTNNLDITCAQMELPLPTADLRAVICVPLNSGADTIGCLFLGSTSEDLRYSNRQKEYLQAIADQTASAIVRSQLISTMEKRAQQLTRLNDAAKRLNSTLEIEPLLKMILESAMQLAGADQGNLLLVDETSGDLINKVNLSKAGYEAPYLEDTSALTVPLEVNHRVLGALELVTEAGSSPMQDEDQKLLSAFASQAATAIENARLYTLTDQNLTNRIQELSIMQQIDLELNANIDLEKALSITLERALQVSGFSTGLIALMKAGEVTHFKVSDASLAGKENAEKFIHIKLEATRGNETTLVIRQKDDGKPFLVETSAIQIITPIKQDGLLVIETTQSKQDLGDTRAFLSRLADHATIAITNGQLFNQIKEADLAKSEFVSFVAHELKNPMTSIKGYSELMAAGAVGPLTEAQSSFLNTIRTNVERMRTIVEDLNDITKIETGQMRLDFKKLNIPDVIETVLNSTKRQASDKNQSLNADVVDENLPVWVDKTRTEQILVNLVTNAIKYTQEGGQIKIAAQKTKDGQVVISITDNGIGISLEDQTKIFTKFFRSEDDRARKSTGAGLGLNITKNLVEMQGGQIWFESQYDHGTTFYVSLPSVGK